METYQKYFKPLTDDFKSLVEAYESYKALPNSVVINEGTDEEYIFVREIDMGYFPITSVSREDFINVGYNAESLTDEQMRHLADKMSDTYVENGGYWEFLEYYAEENELPEFKNNNKEEGK